MRPLIVAVAVAIFAPLLMVSDAFAHAEPARVVPGDGAVLTAPPTQVEMKMSQEMARQADANDIDVFDASGKEVTTVSAVIDNADRTVLTVALPSGLPAGQYTVKWKTLSAEDGDPATGQTTFTVDPNGPASPGKENLREDIATPPPAGNDGTGGSGPESVAPPVTTTIGGSGGGTSWVLVVAVAVGCLALGSGTTFLLIQKKT
ncbi:MAG: copper resistance protein CopC [Hyphomicrobiales bacterium]